MKKIVVDGVDIFNPLQDDKKNKVIEYFVQYYGENIEIELRRESMMPQFVS